MLLIGAAAVAFWFFFIRKTSPVTTATPLPSTLGGASLASKYDRDTSGLPILTGGGIAPSGSSPSPLAAGAAAGFSKAGDAAAALLKQIFGAGFSAIGKLFNGSGSSASAASAEPAASVGSLGLENTAPGGDFLGEGDPGSFEPPDFDASSAADFGTGDDVPVDTSSADSSFVDSSSVTPDVTVSVPDAAPVQDSNPVSAPDEFEFSDDVHV